MISIIMTLITLMYVVWCMQCQQQEAYMGMLGQAQLAKTPEETTAWYQPSANDIARNYDADTERGGRALQPSIDPHLESFEMSEPSGKIMPLGQIVEDDLINAFDGAIEELAETVVDNNPQDWLDAQCVKIREGSLLAPSYRYNQSESAENAAKWKARSQHRNISESVALRLEDYHENPHQENFHRMENMRLSMAKQLGSKMGPGLKKVVRES